MCVTSMIMDHYRDKWTPQIYPLPYVPPVPMVFPQITIAPAISAEEIAEFRRLLERAREYDKRNHEPECELDEKRLALKRIAAQLGIDIAFIDPPAQPEQVDAVDPGVQSIADGLRA